MAALTAKISTLANNYIIRAAAHKWDKINGTHSMESFYKATLFRSPPVHQPDSHLLTLPPEVRLRIHELVFAPPYADKSSTALALLATCRQIHGEAYKLALQTTEFHLRGANGLVFGSKLWTLGVLQQYLRHIKVKMPIEKLEVSGSNNPFVLTQLPLDILDINFGRIAPGGWKGEVKIYHLLIGALLYRSTPKELGNPTRPIHRTILGKRKRTWSLSTWQFYPQRKELYNVMICTKAKRVVVHGRDILEDLLWSAFTHFGLVDHFFTTIQAGKSDKDTGKYVYYLMFGDDQQGRFFEMGRKAEGAAN